MDPYDGRDDQHLVDDIIGDIIALETAYWTHEDDKVPWQKYQKSKQALLRRLADLRELAFPSKAST